MNHEACTVDELIELSTASAPEVFTRLSEVTATATGEGITVTVNLEGRVIALTLAPSALATGPEVLAAEIFRLVQEASAAALNTGIEILTPAAGEDLAVEENHVSWAHMYRMMFVAQIGFALAYVF